MRRPIELWLFVVKDTENAYLVSDTGSFDDAEWVPKSQVYLEENAGVGDTVEFVMPEWLAEEKGFI